MKMHSELVKTYHLPTDSQAANGEPRVVERGMRTRAERDRTRVQGLDLITRLAPVVFALLVIGCQQKMADQPRYEPLEASRFFADGQSARPLVDGVVARGWLEDDPHLLSDRNSAQPLPLSAEREAPSLDRAEDYADTFPIPVTLAAVRRGQERFGIHCAPCHDRLGDGTGPVVEGGFPRAASFHTDRLRRAPPEYLFDVITRGYRKMPSYAQQLSPQERWEVTAYVRALQLSQHAEIDRLPADIRERFEQQE